MFRLQVLYPHPEDPQHFADHYRNVHLPLAKKLPGVISARFSLDVATANADSPYFATFEADFENEEAMIAAMSSQWGQDVEADVPNYASGGAIVLTYPMESLDSIPA